jgi:photosystem II stability/assembly factor-like uncharacterized protein
VAPRLTRSLAALLVAALATVGISVAHGSSGAVTVTATVPSAVTLTNNCTAPSAYQLGSMTPGTSVTTQTGAGICSFNFSSSNDSAMLKLAQRDGAGSAMTAEGTTSTGPYGNAEAVMTTAFDTHDGQLMYAVGSGSRIVRSTDGGDTWTTTANAAGTGNVLLDVSIAPDDPDVAYVSGSAGLLLKTTDGGDTWATVATGMPAWAWVYAVHAVDANTVWIGAEAGWLRKSVNGGTNWTTKAYGSAGTVSDIDSVDANNLVLVGGDGYAYKTTDGGDNWGRVNDGWGAAASVSMVNANVWYKVGTHGWIQKTTNAGTSFTTWGYAETGLFEDLHDVVATSATDAWVVGDRGTMLRTTNGTSWTEVDPGKHVLFRGIDSAGGSTVFAAGDGMTVTKTTDGASFTVKHGSSASIILNDVDAGSQGFAIQVGGEGTVRTSTNRGANWTDRTAGTTADLYGVDLIDGNDIAWAVGGNGTIIKTEDGGISWSAQTSGTTQRLYSVSAVSKDVVYAAGHGGVILKTTNGGSTWTTQASGTTQSLRGIDAVDASTAFVVGGGGVIRRTINGTNWTLTPYGSFPASEDFVSVSAVSANVVFVANRWRYVYTSSNGGTNWAGREVGMYLLGGIEAVTPDIVFVGAGHNLVFRTANAGLAWTSSTSGQSWINNYGIAALDSHMALASGDRAFTQRLEAGISISQYNSASAGWETNPATTNMFGVCMQAIDTATTNAVWNVDDGGTPGLCQMDDDDDWYAVPAAPTKIATTDTAGEVGRVDLVWGMRSRQNQPAGMYASTVVFEAIAPVV